MIRFLFFLTTLSLMFLSCDRLSGKDPSSSALGSGDYDFSMEHSGLERKYIVHVPPSYDAKTPMPLLLAVHGGGGNAAGSVGYFQLNDKSDSEGFILVYPEGTGRMVLGKVFGSWNAGRCCAPGMDNEVDDVGYFQAMLNKLESDFVVDEQRVFVTGMSNGAQMSFRLACELADRIAAIATSGSIGSYDDCKPSRPVPVLHIQGVQDPCSLYDGGECGGCLAEILNKLGIPAKTRTWTCSSVPDYMEEWSRLNGCAGRTEITYQRGSATCLTYQDCQENAEVTLCRVDEMGHTWPGRGTYGAESCEVNPNGYVCSVWKGGVGALSDDINANDALWEFFENHPME